MRINAIVAMSENRTIGKNNQLPWHLPRDLQHFKSLTLGKPILMGRKTFQSIGRPLPNRQNIILTTDHSFTADQCVVVHSIDEALHQTHAPEIFVIGGAELFNKMLDQFDQIYLTLIHEIISGDTFFPNLDMTKWHETERVYHPADDKNQYAMSFIVLQKR